MNVRWIETARGAKVRVFEGGGGTPLVFLHGAGGLFAENPFLEPLARRYRIFAPELPGYGESTGETLLEDMLDFALHGWDVVAALDLERPHLLGHSMGGMIAAEMACLAPRDLGKLVLAAPLGLWIDDAPTPDLFALLPHEAAQVLFHEPAQGAALLTGGLDFRNLQALKEFYIGNVKRLGMAGKILFPIPNRRLAKRLYRLRAETLLVVGSSDRFVPAAYLRRWQELLPRAQLVQIEAAGHMLPYEQPDAFVGAVSRFLG
ncbi:MAG TPA: alpha/beta fold hydrolase [Myxococcota bacterium]|nr:alpha/beta fold hydrolase [Myxococcota bacterium]